MSTSRKGHMLVSGLALFGLINLSFLLGTAVMILRLPPSKFLADGYIGLQTWMAREKEIQRPAVLSEREFTKVDLPGKTFDGYTMLMLAPDRPDTVLVDMHHKVVHSWDTRYTHIFGKAPPHLHGPVDDKLAYAFFGHLYANGDLLVNFHGQTNGVSNGFGMAKIDKDSKVLWTYTENCHHDLDVAEDGTIYGLRQQVVTQPMKGLEYLSRPCMVDNLVVLSSEGKEKDVIPIITALRDSPYAALLGKLEVAYVNGVQKPPTIEEDGRRRDVMHTNHVQVLTRQMADKFPMFKAGQVMLSMRHLDMICVIDPSTRKIVWACRGPWLEQHDPEFLDNGHILLFDNRMGQGWSRVLEIDPVTQGFAWSLSGRADIPFYSFERSNSQRLPNGNTLVSVTHDRVIFEVSPTKEMVWCHPCEGDINFGQRYAADTLTFLDKHIHPR